MAMEGDFRLESGKWQVFFDPDWLNVTDRNLLGILSAYDGVSGEGPGQVFSQRGVDAVVRVNVALASFTPVNDLADDWERLGLNADGKSPWPPIDQITGNLDSDAIRSFLAILKQEESPEADGEPRIFDLRDIGGGFEVSLPGRSGTVHIDAPTAGGALTSVPIPGTDRVLVTKPDGTFSIEPAAATGQAQPQGEVVTIDGRQFIRDANGNIRPLAPERIPTLDEMISQAILDNDGERAVALANFRDQPTSLDRFNAALEHSRAPGDVAAISAIARGQTLVQPGPPGSVQRIAEAPEFLQDAYQRLIGKFKGGGGTPNDIVSLLAQASAESKANQKVADEARDELAARDASDGEKRLQDALDRIDVLENQPPFSGGLPPAPKAPTTFAGTGLDPGPGGTTLDTEAQLFKLLGDVATREPRFEDRITAPVAPIISEENQQILDQPSAPFISEENQEIIDNPLFTPATAERVAELEAIPTVQPTRETSGFFTGLNANPEDDFMAEGGVFDDRTAVVGEDGAEVVVLPVGTKVLSNRDSKKVDSLEELKKRLRGVKPKKSPRFAHGGEIAHAGQSVNELIWAAAIAATAPEDRPDDPFNRALTPAPITVQPTGVLGGASEVPPDANLPFGVRQVLRGGSLQPTRRRLSTAVGLGTLSAQAQQRLLPSERSVLDELRAQAGITRADFEQEQQSAVPGARASSARFRARVSR